MGGAVRGALSTETQAASFPDARGHCNESPATAARSDSLGPSRGSCRQAVSDGFPCGGPWLVPCAFITLSTETQAAPTPDAAVRTDSFVSAADTHFLMGPPSRHVGCADMLYDMPAEPTQPPERNQTYCGATSMFLTLPSDPSEYRPALFASLPQHAGFVDVVSTSGNSCIRLAFMSVHGAGCSLLQHPPQPKEARAP